MDNPNLHDYNAQSRINDFITYVKNQGSHFRTNHVAITTGMDFHYTAAHAWFMNLDKLIKYINEKMDTGHSVWKWRKNVALRKVKKIIKVCLHFS